MIFKDPVEFLNRFRTNHPKQAKFGDNLRLLAFYSFERLEIFIQEFNGNYDLIAALCELIFEMDVFDRSDIKNYKTCIIAFNPDYKVDEIPEAVIEAIGIIHINYHQLSHINQHEFSDSLCQSQILAIKEAAVQVFAQALLETLLGFYMVKPQQMLEMGTDAFMNNPILRQKFGHSKNIQKYLNKLDPIEKTYFKVIYQQFAPYVSDVNHAFCLNTVFQSLVKGSVELLAKRRLNQEGSLHTADIMTNKATYFERSGYVKSNLIPRLRHKAARNTSRKYHGKQYSPKEIGAAVYIQRWWEKLRESDQTVAVNNKTGNHSDIAHHIISNDPNLRKSVNRKQIDRFVKLMSTDKWHEDEMFKSNDYQHYALAAFLSGRISEWQLTTVLKYRSAQRVFGDLTTYPLLTEKYEEVDFAKVRESLMELEGLVEIIKTIPFDELSENKEKTLTISKEQADAYSKYIDLTKKISVMLGEQFPDGLKFSAKAKEHLLPFMMRRVSTATLEPYFRKPITTEQLVIFSKLVAALPESERIFYIPTNLTKELANQKILFDKDYPAVYLSAGTYFAYKLAVYGTSAARLDSRFGKLSIDDIEAGERANVRPGALGTVDSFKTTRVHSVDVSQHLAEIHDGWHSEVFSNFSDAVKPMIFAIVDIARRCSGFEWSREMWSTVDFSFLSQVGQKDIKDGSAYNNSSNFLSTTRFFSHLVHYDLAPWLFGDAKISEHAHYFNSSSNTLFELEKAAPCYLGWIVFIDLVLHPIKWLNLNVDTEMLFGLTKKIHGFVSECYQFIAEAQITIAVLKLTIFYYLKNMKEIVEINNIIDELHEAKQLADVSVIKIRGKGNGLCLQFADLAIDKTIETVAKLVKRIRDRHDQLKVKTQRNADAQMTLYCYVLADPKKDLRTQIKNSITKNGVTLYQSKEILVDKLAKEYFGLDCFKIANDSYIPIIIELEMPEKSFPETQNRTIMSPPSFLCQNHQAMYSSFWKRDEASIDVNNIKACYELDCFYIPDWRGDENEFRLLVGETLINLQLSKSLRMTGSTESPEKNKDWFQPGFLL